MSIFNSESLLHPRQLDMWCLRHLDDGQKWRWRRPQETVKQYYWQVHYEIIDWEEEIRRFYPFHGKMIETL